MPSTDNLAEILRTDLGALSGVWVDDDGLVNETGGRADGSGVERKTTLRPFAWLKRTPIDENVAGISIETLKGDGVFTQLMLAETLSAYDAYMKQAKEVGGVDAVRPLESQYLLQSRQRLFAGMNFTQLRRCQLDIETASGRSGQFSDARNDDDRVLAIGLRFGERERTLVLAELNDEAEKKLLEDLNTVLAEEDPDIIEGHNIFRFDLDYLRLRCRRLKVACGWGRYGQKASFRTSRLKVAERWIDFPRCDLPGRAVIDTYLLIQLYDITTRELTSFGLKEVAVHFGVTEEDSADRTYIVC